MDFWKPLMTVAMALPTVTSLPSILTAYLSSGNNDGKTNTIEHIFPIFSFSSCSFFFCGLVV